MATVSNLKSVTGDADGDYSDTVTETYEVQYDSPQTNFYAALIAAQGATGDTLPPRRAFYVGSGAAYIFASSINGTPNDSLRTLWTWTVTYTKPQEEGEGTQNENPLERPVIYNVEYMDHEYVIGVAKNVEELIHGDGQGGSRAANTEGPIVNAAGEEPDTPHVNTERLEVLVIQRYYPTLAAITAINRAFKRSTNSDSLAGYAARQLRYMLTESLGLTNVNGIEVWPGRTTILAEDTTDLILDNVGTKYWDGTKIIKAKDGAGQDLDVPIALQRTGELAADAVPETITYRHLTEKAYASLIA